MQRNDDNVNKEKKKKEKKSGARKHTFGKNLCDQEYFEVRLSSFLNGGPDYSEPFFGHRNVSLEAQNLVPSVKKGKKK